MSEDSPRRRGRWIRWVAFALGLLLVAGVGVVVVRHLRAQNAPLPRQQADATVTVQPGTTLNTFPGTAALGAGIDGLEKGEIDRVWTRPNLDLMKSAGFGPLSFRLRTELGIKAWHWSPDGTWSDAAHQQGYWVSKPPTTDAGVSYGYSLPRRGNTIDQAANDGYSRLTDGDATSYWKSNPYLDPHFTKGTDSDDPQWVVIYLGQRRSVDELRISWGTPYAKNIKVQYWEGDDGAVFPINPDSGWRDFQTSTFTGSGGEQTARLGRAVSTDYVRVLLTNSSGTPVPGSTGDVRDRLGFAIRELRLGRGGGGGFTDLLTHRPDKQQSVTYASSTDPWHRASDLDGRQEHASFERVFASGLTKGKPLMVPVPVLYGVPEDAGALVSYLRSKGWPVQQIEMGEEPDGQLAQPEHYAALYTQVADELHRVDPQVQLGGPGYQTVIPDWLHWPDEHGNRSWTGRFVAALRAVNRLDDFDFFSFEWYPFDDVCADPATPIKDNPTLLADILARQEKQGLPKDIPKVITELGYSAFAGQAEVELPGAILNAESTAKFLALGGQSVYFYGLEPNWVFQEDEGKPCDTWGNLMLFQFFDEWRTRPVAAYYGARLLTNSWVSGEGEHRLVASATTPAATAPTVTSYALERPDKRLSVMLFNKDPERSVTVRLESDPGDGPHVLHGDLQLEQYSGQQYAWDPTPGDDSHGRPSKNEPPAVSTLTEAQGAVVTLPPYSISVVTAADEASHTASG